MAGSRDTAAPLATVSSLSGSSLPNIQCFATFVDQVSYQFPRSFIQNDSLILKFYIYAKSDVIATFNKK